MDAILQNPIMAILMLGAFVLFAILIWYTVIGIAMLLCLNPILFVIVAIVGFIVYDAAIEPCEKEPSHCEVMK